MSELSKLAREYNGKIGQVHMALGCIKGMPSGCGQRVLIGSYGIETALRNLAFDLKVDYTLRKQQLRSRQKEMEES